MLYFFDSKIAVGDLPFGKEGNDTIFTYFGLRKWFLFMVESWLFDEKTYWRRNYDVSQDSTSFRGSSLFHPISWGNDVAKYFKDLELVIKRSHFGFWSLVDIRGHS